MERFSNYWFFSLAGKDKTSYMNFRKMKEYRKLFVSRYYKLFDEYKKLYKFYPSTMKILHFLRNNTKVQKNRLRQPPQSTIIPKFVFAPDRKKEVEWKLNTELLGTVIEAKKQLKEIFGNLNLDI